MGSLWMEELRRGEKFVIVPVRKTFASKHNVGKALSTYCLFILNKEGELRKGNIVQYLSEDGKGKPLPANSFYRIYNFRDMEANGKFVYLSVADHLQYQYTYKEGKLWAYGEVQKGKGNNTATTQRTAGCIDWYEVTTYYYPDESNYTEEYYLYTTCGSCDPNQPQACPEEFDPEGIGGGGGGGGDSEPEEATAFTTSDWIYAINPGYNWAVAPTEGFTGKKRRTSGYFTSFTHVEDGFMSIAPNYSWERTFLKLERVGGTATVYFAGKISHPQIGVNSIGVKSKTFLFNQVYP